MYYDHARKLNLSFFSYALCSIRTDGLSQAVSFSLFDEVSHGGAVQDAASAVHSRIISI